MNTLDESFIRQIRQKKLPLILLVYKLNKLTKYVLYCISLQVVNISIIHSIR